MVVNLVMIDKTVLNVKMDLYYMKDNASNLVVY